MSLNSWEARIYFGVHFPCLLGGGKKKEGIGKTHLNSKIIPSNDILPGHSLQCNTKELMQIDYPCKVN